MSGLEQLDEDDVLVVRRGPGANCSSIGSALDVLFVTATVAGVILAATAAALSMRRATASGSRERGPGSSETAQDERATGPGSSETGSSSSETAQDARATGQDATEPSKSLEKGPATPVAGGDAGPR